MKIEYQNMQGNRNHKDGLFRMVFSKKKDLLELYNAINGTAYENEEDLEVNTLENVLYMTMKNDVSFMIGNTLNLYEHQSSYNPNMPLRGLFYFARILSKYTEKRKMNLYSSSLQKIPVPRFIVFYNGRKGEPDRKTLRLSDAFEQEGGCLECEAVMLNINFGHNQELMEKCQRLEEYAIFIEKVREYALDDRLELGEAIAGAMEECIAKGILADVLMDQRAEVYAVILETFDKELYESDLRKNIRAEVLEEVREEVKDEIRTKVREEVKDEIRTEVREEVKDEIRTEVREEVKDEVKFNIICKMLEKGKSVDEIAEILEEDAEALQKLIDARQKADF